jgi:sugar phosphate permease
LENGFLADTYGLDLFFITLITSEIAAALLLIMIWNKKYSLFELIEK